jgi:hypothetical protein
MRSNVNVVYPMMDASQLVILKRPPNPISRASKRCGTKIGVEPRPPHGVEGALGVRQQLSSVAIEFDL